MDLGNKNQVEDGAFGFVTLASGSTLLVNATWAVNMKEMHRDGSLIYGTNGGAKLMQGKLIMNGEHHNSLWESSPSPLPPDERSTYDQEIAYWGDSPILLPGSDAEQIDNMGVEDVRLTYNDHVFYAWYCGYNGQTGAACCACSDNLINWQKTAPLPGNINQTDNKDHVVFPRKIAGRWWMLHRPWGSAFSHVNDYVIRLAISHDLCGPWNDMGEILRAGISGDIENIWVGAGSVPIDLGEDRFLMIYHTGAYIRPDFRQYNACAAIIDFSKLKSEQEGLPNLITHQIVPLMTPETEWEKNHELGIDTVFPMGSYVKNNLLYLVYGAGD